MIYLIDSHQARGKLKHVVAERNDDELGVFGALFDVGGYDGDLLLLVKFKRDKITQKRESEVGKVRLENLRF